MPVTGVLVVKGIQSCKLVDDSTTTAALGTQEKVNPNPLPCLPQP